VEKLVSVGWQVPTAKFAAIVGYEARSGMVAKKNSLSRNIKTPPELAGSD
jgi:hypothetical protein